MCEPYHSIVQFPAIDSDDNPTDAKIEAIPLRDNLWEYAKKKIMQWFHFSKLGFGHSESLSLLSAKARSLIPRESRYEVAWWNRKVTLDGRYYGHPWDVSDALLAATKYAQLSSIGNLHLLRRFLEASMRKTSRQWAYLEQFLLILNKKGVDLFQRKLGRSPDASIKLMLGFTRKRDLLVPEWADDSSCWLTASKLCLES